MKKSKRIISLLLCLCLMLGSMAMLSSCNEDGGETGEATNPDGTPATPTTVTAIRALGAISKNERLKRNQLQQVVVSSSDLPEGAITDIQDAIGSYLTVDVVAGEYILASKLADKKVTNGNADNPFSSGEDYVMITDFVKIGADISDKLQEVINNNPNKTIYFPDGVYRFSKSVTTPADPAKSVSFRLSNFAIFQAASNYTPEEGKGMIRLGATDKPKAAAADNAGNSFYFMGGIIDMNNRGGTAISVEGGKNVLINNFAIRKSDIGIHIKTDYVDVDSGVVAGTGTETFAKLTTIGVKVDGSYNTITNMRICSITRGIELTEGNNVLRNLHPLYTTSPNPESAGFWDDSAGNFYDYCYSDNFAIGFHLGEDNVSVLNGCFAFWYSEAPNRHWGIRQNGQFNSVVRNTRIDMCQAAIADNAYIWVEKTGGQGIIVDALTGEGSIEAGYKNMYTAYKK